MQFGEGLGAEESVAESLGFLLHNIKNLCGIFAFGIVLNNVTFFSGDNHANLLRAGSDHPFHQVFGDRLGPLMTVDQARSHWQQFLGTAEGLDTFACPGSRNDSNHECTSVEHACFGMVEFASSKYRSNCRARTLPVCSSNVR